MTSARYILVAVSLALAGHDLTRPIPVHFESVSARILASLTYAFTPAAIAFVFAYFGRWRDRRAGRAETFDRDWDMGWGILLAFLIIAHVAAVVRT